MGILGCGIDCGDGIVQTRRPHGLGTVWDCKYHLVWMTKHRYPVPGGDVGHRCRELIRETSGGHEMVIHAGSINRDHVHLLLSVSPNLSVSRSVQYLKGRSSDKLLREFGALRKRYRGQHLWAGGYRVTGSGNVTDEMWLDDITNQQPPEPDDNFGVTLVRRRADRSGFEPKPEATGFQPVVVHATDLACQSGFSVSLPNQYAMSGVGPSWAV